LGELSDNLIWDATRPNPPDSFEEDRKADPHDAPRHSPREALGETALICVNDVAATASILATRRERRDDAFPPQSVGINHAILPA
jgi:hypothetical protein